MAMLRAILSLSLLLLSQTHVAFGDLVRVMASGNGEATAVRHESVAQFELLNCTDTTCVIRIEGFHSSTDRSDIMATLVLPEDSCEANKCDTNNSKEKRQHLNMIPRVWMDKGTEPPEEQVNDLKRQMSRSRVKLDYVKSMESLNQRRAQEPAALNATAPSLEEMLRLADIRFEATQALDEASDKLRKLQQSNNYKAHLGIEVRVPADVPQSAYIELKYPLCGVTWRPEYEAHVTNDTVELRVKAMVTQNTNADWSDVDLHLVTSNLSLQPPNPANLRLPWMLHGRSPRNRWNKTVNRCKSGFDNAPEQYFDQNLHQMRQQMRAATSFMFNGGDLDGSPEDDSPPAGLEELLGEDVQIDVQNSGHATIIARKASVSGDGTVVPVTIGSMVYSDVDWVRYAAADLTSKVHLRAMLVNRFPFPLLPGRMVTVVDDAVVADTRIWHPVSASGRFNVFAGQDPKVSVKSRRITDSERSNGWISSEIKEAHSRLFVIRNSGSDTVIVNIAKLVPQVPHEQKDKYKVELSEPKSPHRVGGNIPVSSPSDVDDAENWPIVLKDDQDVKATLVASHRVEYFVRISPHEEKQVPFSYTVRHIE